MFFKKSFNDTYSFLIAGLGNPGEKYDATRHNVGFAVIEELADRLHCSRPKSKFNAEIFDCKIKDNRCLLVKPQTFMNNSGEAISKILNFYKLTPEKLIVISDDVSLNVGQLRIRSKGSDGGHNGLKSIINLTGSQNFTRIKIGVGKKPHPDYDLADWVLGRFKKENLPEIKKAVEDAASAAQSIICDGVSSAMNKFNR